MTLHIPLSPETESKLRERAEAAGKDLATFVREVVEGMAGEPNGTPHGNGTLPPDQWSTEWRAWASEHRTRDHAIDDSRESIYTGRGE